GGHPSQIRRSDSEVSAIRFRKNFQQSSSLQRIFSARLKCPFLAFCLHLRTTRSARLRLSALYSVRQAGFVSTEMNLCDLPEGKDAVAQDSGKKENGGIAQGGEVKKNRGARKMATQNFIAPDLDYKNGTHFPRREDWTELSVNASA